MSPCSSLGDGNRANRPETSNRPWDPETPISTLAAARTIESQFGELAPARVELLGEGWDNTVFLVNGTWVFRFPRRRVAVRLVETEFAVLPRLAERMTIAVPIPVYLGAPTEAFPSVFLGYRRIPGSSACRVPLSASQRTRLAVPLAEFLRHLHEIPCREAEGWGVLPDRLNRLAFGSRQAKTLAGLEQLKRAGMVQETKSWRQLAEQIPDDFIASRSTLVHGDLHACQLLLTRRATLSGIIDWGDLHLGDPAVDLALAWSFLPAPARRRFRQAYGEIPESRWLMARQRALFTTVILAGYALEKRDDDLAGECSQALQHLR